MLVVVAGGRDCASNLEGITRCHSSLLQAAFEPADTLRGGAMGEALRTHCSTLHSLQVVVADGCRCLQTGRDVGIVNDLTLLRAVRPDARETVRLKFEID